eukprot:TRINITY_DN894_c0_g1_i8.p1 TRINITY_DN894_c0_g1~~TRINITY_DN894_c0_g1_i8.p1  ORF type:complete len:103 (+),score=0.69 TRINITY_DN894_c0_g1_i8:32-310(+)
MADFDIFGSLIFEIRKQILQRTTITLQIMHAFLEKIHEIRYFGDYLFATGRRGGIHNFGSGLLCIRSILDGFLGKRFAISCVPQLAGQKPLV